MVFYPNDFRRILSETLKQYRADHQMTQEQMAELLHIGARSYSNLERHKSLCSCKVLIYLLIRLPSDGVLQLVARLKSSVATLEDGQDETLSG